MKNNCVYNCALQVKMYCEDGLRFLEDFVKIDNHGNRLFDFNEFKQTPEDITDSLRILDWRIKNWGSDLCSWVNLVVQFTDIHHDCCGTPPVHDIHIHYDENDKMIMESHEWYDWDKYNIKKIDGSLYTNYYEFITKCKNESNEDNNPFTDCIIYIRFFTDNIPLEFLKYINNKYAEEMILEYVSDSVPSDCGCIGYINFNHEGYNVIEYNDDKNYKYYEKLIRGSYLKFDELFENIQHKMYNICYNTERFESKTLAENIIIGLEKMKDKPTELAKIIVSVNKLYDEYIKAGGEDHHINLPF